MARCYRVWESRHSPAQPGVARRNRLLHALCSHAFRTHAGTAWFDNRTDVMCWPCPILRGLGVDAFVRAARRCRVLHALCSHALHARFVVRTDGICACAAQCCRVQAPVHSLAQPGDAGCLLSCSLFRAPRCFRVLGVSCLCFVRVARGHRVLVSAFLLVYFSHLVFLSLSRRFLFASSLSLSLSLSPSLSLTVAQPGTTRRGGTGYT